MSITSLWPVLTDDDGSGLTGTILNNAQHNLDRDAINLLVGDWTAWTPTIGGSTSQSGQAYTSQIGRYKKTNLGIEIYGQIVLSTLGTITGSVQIKGLPVVSTATTGRNGIVSIPYFQNLITAVVMLGGYVGPNMSAITLQMLTAAATGTSTLAQANLSGTTVLIFGGFYETDT